MFNLNNKRSTSQSNMVPLFTTKLGKDFKEDKSIDRVWVNRHTNTESQRINLYIFW